MAVITLTTDFGTRDPYVAEMKAAILSITRDVHVVDITHEVAPHDVLEGALALESAAPWFPWPRARVAVGRVGGAVVHVDRFGNLLTSIPGDTLGSLGSGVTVRVGNRTVPLVQTYGELARGRAGALVGSRNRLEIAVNTGSAAAMLRARRGTPVVVSRVSPAASRRRR